MRKELKQQIKIYIIILLFVSLIYYHVFSNETMRAYQTRDEQDNDIIISFITQPLVFSSQGDLTDYNINATNQTLSTSALTIINNGSQPIQIQMKINQSVEQHIHLKWNTLPVPPFYSPFIAGIVESRNIYANEADGYAKYFGDPNVTWPIIHDAVIGNQWNNTTGWYDKGIYGLYAPREYRYVISRAFFPFDTSIIPDNMTLRAASLLLTGRDIGVANTSICIVNWTDGYDGVYLDDFSKIGHDLLSKNITWNIARYNNMSLNKMGLSIINKTGYSYFCAQEYNHDFLNITPTEDLRNSICFRERNDMYHEDPYLWVSYANDTLYSCENEIHTTYSIVNNSLPEGDQLQVFLWADFDQTKIEQPIIRQLNISVQNLVTNIYSYYTQQIIFQPWNNNKARINPNNNVTPEIGCSKTSLMPTCTVWVDDLDGDLLTCNIYSSQDGINWNHEQTYENIINDTLNWNYSEANQYATTYYWKVTANDTYHNTSKIFYFTTTSSPEPPANFTAESYNTSCIILYWNQTIRSDYVYIVKNETGYTQYPNTPTNGTVFIIQANNRFFYDYNCTSNFTYYYAAWGYNITTDEYSNVSSYATTKVEVLEINQSVHNRGFPIRHAADGDWAGAQDFISHMQILKGLNIYLRKFGIPEFNLTVELRKNSIDGLIIDILTFPPEEISSTWTWFTLDFNDTNISPDTSYFIICPPAPDGVSTSFGYEWAYAFENQYDDGSFWFTRDSGNLWRDLPTMYEFTFRTYGIF